MTDAGKYDESLSAILLEQKSIIGFLSTVFNFLARRTDFYYVPKGAYENVGFPPGIAEELTIKVLRNCDPERLTDASISSDHSNLNDDIMCSTVAQEVEVVAEADEDEENYAETVEESHTETVSKEVPFEESSQPPVEPNSKIEHTAPVAAVVQPSVPPQLPPAQKNSEAYNGAVRENYSWAQTLLDLDVTVTLPPEVKSSKDIRVCITSMDICVEYFRNKVILKDTFTHKVKTQDTFWSLSEGRLLIHLEKQQERWWNALITSEEPIDLSKIDCSRPLDELPEDHVAKVRELQWNHERKLRGLPTSDELQQLQVLRRAWDAEGSPFKGKPFDPSVLRP